MLKSVVLRKFHLTCDVNKNCCFWCHWPFSQTNLGPTRLLGSSGPVLSPYAYIKIIAIYRMNKLFVLGIWTRVFFLTPPPPPQMTLGSFEITDVLPLKFLYLGTYGSPPKLPVIVKFRFTQDRLLATWITHPKYLIRSLGLLLTKNDVFKKKKKYDKKIALKKQSSSSETKEDFQNCSKLAFFKLFQAQIFLSFLFFSPKNVFFSFQIYFCCSQKTNLDPCHKYSQNYVNLFGKKKK